MLIIQQGEYIKFKAKGTQKIYFLLKVDFLLNVFHPWQRHSLIATSQTRLRYGLIITFTTHCMCYIQKDTQDA